LVGEEFGGGRWDPHSVATIEGSANEPDISCASQCFRTTGRSLKLREEKKASVFREWLVLESNELNLQGRKEHHRVRRF
jgi:hypothetical protein